MSTRPRDEVRPAPGRSWGLTLALVVLAIAAAFVGWQWWQARQPAPPGRTVVLGPLAPDDGTPPHIASDSPALAARASSAAQASSAPQHPIEPAPASASASAPDPAASRPADGDSLLRVALNQLLGSASVAQFLQTDGFARRVAATVDNLAREQVPTTRWPVQPAPSRFEANGEGDARAIDPANSVRYAPFVQFAESVDTAKVAALYRKHYSLFQKAYEELGYPGRYFNDRLVEVIDHLLQAPEPAAPPKVTQVEIKGPYKSANPWTRYEFADPELEALSGGQKMMVRMGLENERRLKAKLREVRATVAAR